MKPYEFLNNFTKENQAITKISDTFQLSHLFQHWQKSFQILRSIMALLAAETQTCFNSDTAGLVYGLLYPNKIFYEGLKRAVHRVDPRSTRFFPISVDIIKISLGYFFACDDFLLSDKIRLFEKVFQSPAWNSPQHLAEAVSYLTINIFQLKEGIPKNWEELEKSAKKNPFLRTTKELEKWRCHEISSHPELENFWTQKLKPVDFSAASVPDNVKFLCYAHWRIYFYYYKETSFSFFMLCQRAVTYRVNGITRAIKMPFPTGDNAIFLPDYFFSHGNTRYHASPDLPAVPIALDLVQNPRQSPIMINRSPNSAYLSFRNLGREDLLKMIGFEPFL